MTVGGPGDINWRIVAVVAVGMALLVGGAMLSGWAHTDGGDVVISDTSFETESGVELHGSVYEPAGVTAEEPAPTVVLIHGYTANEDSMSNFALEFARRGYVAVTVDQPGHGDSDPPAFADGWGGPAALSGVRDIESVDEERVMLMGYSMGGFASLAAAEEHPDAYESVVLVGSTTGDEDPASGESPNGTTGLEEVPSGDESFPRNMAVIFGTYDELSLVMWDESVPADVHRSEKLAGLFGTDPPVEEGRVYGDSTARTARTFVAPDATHIRMHHSTQTIGESLQWASVTLDGPAEPDPLDQQWRWAVHGNTAAFLGALLVSLTIPALLRRSFGERLPTVHHQPLPRIRTALLAGVPALTFYPAQILAVLFPVPPFAPQGTTNGTLLWAGLTAALFALLYHWRYGIDRAQIDRLRPNRTQFGRAALTAVGTVSALYVLVYGINALTTTTVQLWSLQLRPLTPTRWLAVGLYAFPLSLVALGLAAVLHRVVGPAGSLLRDLVRAPLAVSSGTAILLAVQYAPLFLGYGLPVPIAGLLTISLLYHTLLLGFLAVVSTVVYRTTGDLWRSALTVGLLGAWLLAGVEPFHTAPY